MELIKLLKMWQYSKRNIRGKRQSLKLKDKDGWTKPLVKLTEEDIAKMILIWACNIRMCATFTLRLVNGNRLHYYGVL